MAAAKKSPTYLISFGTSAPGDLAARIQAAGGKVKKINTEAGIASATSDAADFSTKIRALPGIEGVGKDRVLQWIDPKERVSKASIGDDEGFFDLQWAPKAIHAPAAWDAGARGAGVRVAVLDGGLNNTHVDLQGGVDEACSVSMIEGLNYNQEVGPFSHATHVAGIIAARDNGIGTIGVAPQATIIGVKVLHEGSGSFGDVIDGIMYAANPSLVPGKESCRRADVINMSLGATFAPAAGDKELLKALDRATTYADKHGVTVIASAGNDGVDLDHAKNLVTIPAQSARVIAVSATGPVDFANGGTNFTRVASYTNFGKSLVELAAPGGDATLYPNGLWFLDMILSPAGIDETDANIDYFFAAGTSMAAPHVAGVAALIIEKNGGSMKPSQVEAALRRSADDLGKPGNDAFYGQGFVNALRAVQ
jgi:subtilisin family serine protease